jgi:hypothetical protein
MLSWRRYLATVRKEWVAEYRNFAAMDERETGFHAFAQDWKLWVEPIGD